MDIQGEAMRSDPSTAVDTDRADLALLFYPDTRQTLYAPGFESKPCQRINDRLFDGPQEPMEIGLGPLQVEDRIANELPWIVHGGFTATIDLDDVDVTHGQQIPLRQNAPLLRRTT